MWAHYASSHQGFLVEFDSSSAFFNQPKKNQDGLYGSLMPVSYSFDRPAITMLDPTDDSWPQRLTVQTLLCKSLDWSYEKEWRMFLPLNDPSRSAQHVVDNRFFLFEFPPDALTAVVFGARASDETKAEVSAILKSTTEMRHVRILAATISVHRFEVTIGNPA